MRGGELIKFSSRLSDLQPIQRGQWINSLHAALARVFRAAYACLGLSRAPLRVILRVVHLAPLMHGCRIGLLFFHLQGPLTIKEERITHTNKRHAGPVMGWHLLCHNLGSFHGSLNRKCNRAPACPCALPLPVLIESRSVGLALCTYQIGFSWFDQQFKMVVFFLIIIIKKDAVLHVLLWSICTNISAGDDLSQPEPGGAVCSTKISRGVQFIDEGTNLPSLKAKSCPYVSVPSTANSTFPLCSHSCLSPR